MAYTSPSSSLYIYLYTVELFLYPCTDSDGGLEPGILSPSPSPLFAFPPPRLCLHPGPTARHPWPIPRILGAFCSCTTFGVRLCIFLFLSIYICSVELLMTIGRAGSTPSATYSYLPVHATAGPLHTPVAYIHHPVSVIEQRRYVFVFIDYSTCIWSSVGMDFSCLYVYGLLVVFMCMV